MRRIHNHKLLDGFEGNIGEVIGIGPFTDRGNMAVFRTRTAAEQFVKEDPRAGGLIASRIVSSSIHHFDGRWVLDVGYCSSYLARMDNLTAHAMALDMPGTAVKEHFGRPSYSVKKKTYLTVWPHENRAVMKLTVQQQAVFGEAHPDAFSPVESKLGKHGWTAVSMDHISERRFRYAMDLAWRNVAPKWLIPTRQAPPGE